jgi:competence protein ComEC
MTYSIIHIMVAYATGAGIGIQIPLFLPPATVYGAAAALLVLSVLGGRRRRRLLSGLLVSIALLGFMRAQAVKLPETLYRRASYLTEVTGTIVSYPELARDSTAFEFAPDHLPGKIRITCFWNDTEPARLFYGDRLFLTGKVRIPERFGEFDYRAYLARRGIFATMTVEGKTGAERIGTGGNTAMRWGDRTRQRLFAELEESFSPVEAGLVRSLLLGERSALEPELEEGFRRTGLMHLLAVSGLHLSVFLAGFWALLRLSGLRPALTYPVIGLFVLGALWVVGPRVSLIRAALLFAFLGFGSVLADLGATLRCWVRPSRGLAAAALVILAVRPGALFDAGFQLSFGATGGILFVLRRSSTLWNWMNERMGGGARRRILHYPFTLLLVSAAAQMGALPFMLYHFATFHPYILLANLIAIPLVTGVLWISVFTVICLCVSGTSLMTTLLQSVLRSLIGVVEWLAALPGCQLAAPPWMGIWVGGMVCYGVAAAFILTYLRHVPENRYRSRPLPRHLRDRFERSLGGEGTRDNERAGSKRLRR